MDSQRTGSYEPGQRDAAFVTGGDRLATETAPAFDRVSTRSNTGFYPGTSTGENVMTVRNRVQWGPIIAGLLTTVASMLVLTVLGLAIGTSAFEPRDRRESIGTAAAIWGAISAIISFFLGGWVAAKTAAVGGGFSGLMNGLMVGATALALILYLTGTGLGNLFGTIGSNLGDIANVAQDAAGVASVDQAQSQAQDTAQDAQQAVANVTDDAKQTFLDAEESAWGTLGGLVLALGASALGGLVGHNKRRDLIEGTR